MTHNITVEGGKSLRLYTAGKYCDRDIVITAGGGVSGGLVLCGEASEVGSFEFDNTSLTSVDLPNATSIDAHAFQNCSALTSVNLPSAKSIGEIAFQDCSALTSVNLPSATVISNHAFAGCTALTSVDLPNVTNIGKLAFWECNFASVNFPIAKSIGQSAFQHCTALTRVDLPAVTSIGQGAFFGCTNLKTFIIRNEDAVCELDVTAIVSTGILTEEGAPTGEGFLYLPTKFYEEYVAMMAMQVAYLLMQMMGMGEAEAQATADYMTRAVIRKIEDYPEICG